MIKYISIFRLVLRFLLVARKENSTGFSTGLTGRSKNLDPTSNPTGFHLWLIVCQFHKYSCFFEDHSTRLQSHLLVQIIILRWSKFRSCVSVYLKVILFIHFIVFLVSWWRRSVKIQKRPNKYEVSLAWNNLVTIRSVSDLCCNMVTETDLSTEIILKTFIRENLLFKQIKLFIIIAPKRVTSLQGLSPRHCTWAIQLLLKKCRSGSKPLATLCLNWTTRDLNLRSPVPDTNARPTGRFYCELQQYGLWKTW